MVKHIILWQLKEEYNTQEKEDIKAGINTCADRRTGIFQCRCDVGLYF